MYLAYCVLLGSILAALRQLSFNLFADTVRVHPLKMMKWGQAFHIYIYIYIFESESNKRFGVRCTSLLSQDRSQLYIVLLLRRILPKCWRMRNLSRTRLVIDWMRWCFFVCAVSPFIFLILYKIRYWIRKALSWKRIGINNTWCRILWNNNNKNRFFLEMASFCEGSLEGLERIQLRDSIAGRRRRIPID